MSSAGEGARFAGSVPLDTGTAAVAVVDGHGTIRQWSHGAQELLGYRPEEAVGRPAAMLLDDPVDLSLPAAGGGATAPGAAGGAAGAPERAGAPRHAVLTLRGRDGQRLVTRLDVFPLLGGGGSPHWLVVAAGPAGQGTVLADPTGPSPVEAETGAFHARCRSGPAAGTARGPVLGGQRGPQRSSGGDAAPAGTVPPPPDAVTASRDCRERQRLALVNKASVMIGTTLDVERTARELTEALVPQVADFATVDLLDAVTPDGEAVFGDRPDWQPLRRAAHRSVHDDLPEAVVRVGDLTYYPPSFPQWRCLATARPVLDAVLGRATDWLTEDPVRLARLLEMGIHSHLVAPLCARGLTIGVVRLMRWRDATPFDDDDLLLVEDLTGRAAVSIDKARRFTRQHHAALTLQRSLLPHGVPKMTAVEVAWRYLPADSEAGVSGDWFDVIPLSGARVALVVGDVVGHGLHAAATMGRLRTAVQTLADLDLPPDELLSHLDDLVIQLDAQQDPSETGSGFGVVGATCLYAVYDPVTSRVVVARAGHPPPVIARLDDPAEFPEVPAGPPLGLGGMPFECAELEVVDGDVIALYTDGLIEARREDIDLGFERLGFALAHPDRPLEEICDTIARTVIPDRPHDDVTFLACRTHRLAGDAVATWELPEEPTAAARARHLVHRTLNDWGMAEIAFTAELIVSELVTNSVRHATGPIRLRLIRDRVLTCEIYDGSSTAPHLRRARSLDEGGRGLFLVAQCAQRWGTRYTVDGKITWAELARPECRRGSVSEP